MKKLKSLLFIPVLLFLSCSLMSQESEININENIRLIKLNESFYVHVTLFEFPGFGLAPSNGLIFVKNGKAIMVDTPNNDAQTKQLVEYLSNNMGIVVEKVILGHSHSDCMGGLNYLKSIQVESISNVLTKEICKKQNLPIPSKTFTQKMEIDFHGEKVVCEYFGGGHTIDNIVVHFPEHKVLFGGCLIRAAGARGLGNIAEADIEHWDQTVKKILDTYPKPDFVIPGHGAVGDHQILTHTIKQVEIFKQNQK